jgi:hypothetical protein
MIASLKLPKTHNQKNLRILKTEDIPQVFVLLMNFLKAKFLLILFFIIFVFKKKIIIISYFYFIYCNVIIFISALLLLFL